MVSKSNPFFGFFFCLLTVFQAYSQSNEELNTLKGYSFQVFYSPGNEVRAKTISDRCEKTMDYIASLVPFRPEISLYILDPIHWEKYGTFPVYGMPHYTSSERLVIASKDNDFWKSFIPPLDQLPEELAEKVKIAYTTEDGSLSMMPFFDLLALHELGHGFHLQGGLTMQRLWMQEFFSNILLHTYVAENEPYNLPALEAFPEMVVSADKSDFEFTSLADFERLYDNMAPKNYGWYQCKLHVAAKDYYNAEGKDAFMKLWKGLSEKKPKLTSEEFTSFLESVSEELVRLQTDW
jgi:hypothetical protein